MLNRRFELVCAVVRGVNFCVDSNRETKVIIMMLWSEAIDKRVVYTQRARVTYVTK